MLEAFSVTKTFGANRALNAVSLRVEGGEIYCLLGANGAGKTTLINHFLGFLSPTEGRVVVNGRDVSEHPLETKQDMAYIPEQVNLYGVLSGIENLDYFAALATGERLSKERLLELLLNAGLPRDAVTRRVATYSKGMRQKVGIAIALAKNAKALLLDEPTSGLDPSAANEFSQLLTQAREDGVAILTTTHDLFHAKQTGTRIGIMKRGNLVEELASADISHADLEALYLQHMKD
ncbi:ABC transporter ATP-binding protein [Novosphingobium sp. BL-52-GroH]|uniref:ABC transporter ATP-binding protein n=1 Tax=Novosphingobium sp. BL-52-GroH TaxID=3349877 RepID=UPI00384DAC22